MKKIPKQAYTAEFKELTVKRVMDGQAIVPGAKELGRNEPTLRNCVKAAASGKLTGAGSKVVTPETMELSRLRAENPRLKRANEIIKNSGVLRSGCSVRYVWIEAHGKAFALKEMCAVSEVSISGYRAWKRGGTPGRKRLSDAQILTVIRTLHVELKGAYDSRRVIRELRLRGFTAGKERVERLIRENGIHARHERRSKVTMDSKHGYGLPAAVNLLDRDFTPAASNCVWASDIMYRWTEEGWLCLPTCQQEITPEKLYLCLVLDRKCTVSNLCLGFKNSTGNKTRHYNANVIIYGRGIG